MRRIASRDPNALRAMYDKYSSMVYTIGLRVLGRPEEAEELVSEVFWELWDKSSRYDRSRAAPTTYLVTLARSRAIDRSRRKANRTTGTVELVEEISPVIGITPLEDAELDEQRERVREALKGLTPNHRQAIESAYYDGLSHTEIAEKLGKPLGTIKTYIRQGLIHLRDALRNE
ncbi:MAG: RNA polymerase sigma factor [Phycisphaerae bacterium]|nr:MAG: RNA polymerase sigma factor [Phycisphaerae bacterium]